LVSILPYFHTFFSSFNREKIVNSGSLFVFSTVIQCCCVLLSHVQLHIRTLAWHYYFHTVYVLCTKCMFTYGSLKSCWMCCHMVWQGGGGVLMKHTLWGYKTFPTKIV